MVIAVSKVWDDDLQTLYGYQTKWENGKAFFSLMGWHEFTNPANLLMQADHINDYIESEAI